MAKQSSTQKKASKLATQAPATLQASEQSYLENPLYQGLQGLGQNILNNPNTFSPELIAEMKGRGANAAHAGASNFLDQSMSHMSGVGSGARSGAANRMQSQTASRLGGALAQNETQIDTQAAQQKNADMVNAFNLISGLLAQRYAFPSQIANAQLGAGNTLTGLAGQPSPFASALGGFGSLAGTLLGAPVGTTPNPAGGSSGGGSLFSHLFGI